MSETSYIIKVFATAKIEIFNAKDKTEAENRAFECAAEELSGTDFSVDLAEMDQVLNN